MRIVPHEMGDSVEHVCSFGMMEPLVLKVFSQLVPITRDPVSQISPSDSDLVYAQSQVIMLGSF